MKKLSKAEKIAQFLLDPRRDIELFGMFGAENLGDEAMLYAGEENLPPGRMVPVMNARFTPLAAAIRRRHRQHLLIGGGTLVHGGNDGWLRHVELRVSQGSRLSLFGTGIAFLENQIEPPSDQFQRWSKLMREAGAVALRGPLSQATAARMGVKAEIFGDFAFLLFDRKRLLPQGRQRQDRIGFNIGQCLGDQAHYEHVCVDLLRRLSAEGFIEFFVLTPGDAAATYRVIGASGLGQTQYRVQNIYSDPYVFMEATRDLRLFVGMKLHGSGLAMVSGAPALLFSYLQKCHDFVLPIGMEHVLIDLSASAAEATEKLEDALSNPERYTAVSAIEEMAMKQRARLDAYFGASVSR